jgi:hypothetical protein
MPAGSADRIVASTVMLRGFVLMVFVLSSRIPNRSSWFESNHVKCQRHPCRRRGKHGTRHWLTMCWRGAGMATRIGTGAAECSIHSPECRCLNCLHIKPVRIRPRRLNKGPTMIYILYLCGIFTLIGIAGFIGWLFRGDDNET